MNDLLQNDQSDIKNPLEHLVGDGKKFKTVEDLAKGKLESDQYIEILKQRQDEMREDYIRLREETDKRAKLEDVINQIQSQQKQLSSSDNNPTAKEDKPSFDPKQLESLVSSKIQEHEANRKATDNFTSVKARLQERYGDKFSETLKKQIDDLGLTPEDANALARRSPQAFFKTFGLDTRPQGQDISPPRSQMRNDSFAPTGAPKRTWSYYQELKKKDPNIYYDKATAVQMQADAISLGEAFQDGDYWKRGLHEQ